MKKIKVVEYVNNTRGAITIFLIIIFLSLLALAGLMIDVGRILAADRRVENALNAAARSILADYDKNMVGEFGIYGVNVADKEIELQRYIHVNLKERHNGFRFINYQIKADSVSIMPLQGSSFINDETYKRQILEYMKYKAPITITESVIDKFKQGLEAKNKVAQKGKELINKRKKLMNQIEDLNDEIIQAGKSIGQKAGEKIIGEFQGNAKDKIKELMSLEQGYKEDFFKPDSVLNQYKETMEETNKLAQEANNSGDAEINGGFEDSETSQALTQKFEGLQNIISFNLEKLKEIESIQNQLNTEKARDTTTPEEEAAKDSAIAELETQIQAKAKELRPFEEIKMPEPKLDKLENDDGADGLLSRIEKVWASIDPQIKDADKVFSSGGSNDDDDPNINDSRKSLRNNSRSKTEDQSENILTYIGNLLSKIFVAARDRIYTVEYIMDKYTFVTSGTERDHVFPKGEVEYILSGKNSQLANAISVFDKLFLMRFSINTLHNFITSKIPNPLVRIAWALVEGLLKAVKDLLTLYSGNPIELCPKTNINVSYSDHLRILLLIQDEQTQLNRMRDLVQADIRAIEESNGFVLGNYHTKIHTEVSVDVNLWFAPMLHLDKLGISDINGNKYTIHKSVVVAY